MAQTVAETLVAVLERIGGKQIFALIGDSLNPPAEAVRSSSIEWIGVRHEEGAALAASGQATLPPDARVAVIDAVDAAGTCNLTNGCLTRQKLSLFQWLVVPQWSPTDKDSVPTDSGASSTPRTASSPALWSVNS